MAYVRSVEVKDMGKKKTIALFMSVILVFSFLFSFLFVVREAHHDCIGEDCPICECIEQCQGIIKDLSIAIIPVLVITSMVSYFIEEYQEYHIDIDSFSLIKHKIRFNN